MSALLYVGARRRLLSASWDRQLLVHDEALADGGRLLRSLPSGHSCEHYVCGVRTLSGGCSPLPTCRCSCYYGPASHYATFGGDRAADGSTGSYLPEVCPPVSPCTFRSATLPDDAACDALCAAAGCACKPSPWLLYKQTARGARVYYCSERADDGVRPRDADRLELPHAGARRGSLREARIPEAVASRASLWISEFEK